VNSRKDPDVISDSLCGHVMKSKYICHQGERKGHLMRWQNFESVFIKKKILLDFFVLFYEIIFWLHQIVS